MGGESRQDVEMTKVVCQPLDPFTCYWENCKYQLLDSFSLFHPSSDLEVSLSQWNCTFFFLVQFCSLVSRVLWFRILSSGIYQEMFHTLSVNESAERAKKRRLSYDFKCS